ncbi:hypothetical protein AYO38_00995 [bacterium SCGC AG-212-C10]|nr:hypothetical protein AYO38_00995 [bacterium SCGC AG-212-C10]
MAYQKRWSLSVPMDGYTLAEHAAIAQELEGLGYTDAWSLEVDGVDAFSPLAVIAMATNMRVGTAIANVYTRGPATLASQAAGIAEIAPNRFELGIGSGSQPIVEGWNNLKFDRPATRVREMVQFLRQALAGDRVVFEGKTFQVNGFRLSRPPSYEVPIHVAALRKGMLKVAGEVGDGCVVNWLSAEDVKKSVKVVREAAAAAGRDPQKIEITARLIVNMDPPSPESDLAVRRHITAYLNVPVYEDFHRWLGRDDELGGMWDAWKAGDRKASVAAIPEKTIDDLIIRGSVEERAAHIQRYLDAGVDTVFLNITSSEPDRKKRAELILQDMRDLAPKHRDSVG